MEIYAIFRSHSGETEMKPELLRKQCVGKMFQITETVHTEHYHVSSVPSEQR